MLMTALPPNRGSAAQADLLGGSVRRPTHQRRQSASSTGEFERCSRSLLALTGTTDDPATGTSTIGRDLDPQFKKTALRQGFLPEV